MTTIRSAVCVRCPPRWLMLRVETDDGEVGWGEAIGDLHDEVEIALNAIGERVEGSSIHDSTNLVETYCVHDRAKGVMIIQSTWRALW